MNKKISAAFIAAILIIPTTANAALKTEVNVSKPTVVVIDTGLDTSIPMFSGRIAQEVCILDWNTCPNGKNFMEGPGASVIPSKFINKNGFDHGTQMTSILLGNNSDINVVFIRIVGNTATGSRQIITELPIVNALNWAFNNKDKYNVQAVTMSQGNHNLFPGKDYCPKTVSTQNQIKRLISVGIPTFLPAGNGRDYKRIDWPACIDDSVSIGAATDYDEIPIWANVDVLKTDFYALGQWDATIPGNEIKSAVGSSVSVQIAAAKWLEIKKNKPSLSYSDIYDLMSKTSTVIANPTGLTGKLMNVTAALNG